MRTSRLSRGLVSVTKSAARARRWRSGGVGARRVGGGHAGLHARAPAAAPRVVRRSAGVAAAGGAAGRARRCRAKRARCARSVSTSDVTSTQAPVTTCSELMMYCLPLSTVSAPSVICSARAARAAASTAAAAPPRRRWWRRRGRSSPGSAASRTSAPTRCAKWIAIFAIPVRRNELAERQREVGDRQARVGVAHRRADDDLHVDRPPCVDDRDASAAARSSGRRRRAGRSRAAIRAT